MQIGVRMKNQENSIGRAEERDRIRERLFGLAFAYRDTKIWKKVKERQAFAVERAGGEILYACILDVRQGENWLTVFTREELRNFELVLSSRLNPFPEEITMFYRMISIGCRQCRIVPKSHLTDKGIAEIQQYADRHGASLSGKAAWPGFVKYTAYQESHDLVAVKDMERLSDVLEAVCDFAAGQGKKSAAQVKKLIPPVKADRTDQVPVLRRGEDGKYALAGEVPFPAWDSETYTVSTAWDRDAAAAIKKKRRRGTIACGVIWGASPIPGSVEASAEDGTASGIETGKDVFSVVDSVRKDKEDEEKWRENGKFHGEEDGTESFPGFIFPAILLAVDLKNGDILLDSICQVYAAQYEDLVKEFLMMLEERRTRPTRVIARDERTCSLLRDVMEAAGIELTTEGDIDKFLEAEISFQEEVFGASDMYDPWDSYSEDEDWDEDEWWNDDDEDDEAALLDALFSEKSVSKTEEEMRRLIEVLLETPDYMLASVSEDLSSFLHLLSILPISPELKKKYDELMNRMDRLESPSPFTAAAAKSTGSAGKKKKGKGGKKDKGEDAYRQMSLLDTDMFGIESEEREKFIRDYLWEDEWEDEDEEEQNSAQPEGTGSRGRASAQILSFPGSQNASGSGAEAGSGPEEEGRKRKGEPLSYIIRVSYGRSFYREIRIDADDTFDDLHHAIRRAVEFDDDHLYAFFMDNKAWSGKAAIYSPRDDLSRHTADKITLRACSLSIGSKFLYLYDFGDEWRFSCRVTSTIDLRTQEPCVVKSKGTPPSQYG